MDAIQYLRNEHSKFRKILKQISVLKDENKKKRKFEAFCQDLLHHEKMEQKAWYPILRKDSELKEIIKHLVSEEKSAAEKIKKIQKMGYGLMWKLRFYKFSHDVDHHAKEEEQELFPEVRKKFSKNELNVLGTKMRKFKAKLKNNSR